MAPHVSKARHKRLPLLGPGDGFRVWITKRNNFSKQVLLSQQNQLPKNGGSEKCLWLAKQNFRLGRFFLAGGESGKPD